MTDKWLTDNINDMLLEDINSELTSIDEELEVLETVSPANRDIDQIIKTKERRIALQAKYSTVYRIKQAQENDKLATP